MLNLYTVFYFTRLSPGISVFIICAANFQNARIVYRPSHFSDNIFFSDIQSSVSIVDKKLKYS